MPDRIPKPAPFKVGTRVRYLGHDRAWADAEMTKVLMEHGMVFTITETKPGRRGTLTQLRDEDGWMFYEDTGEPMLDETRDAYSIYQQSNGHGRIIWPDAADQWEVVVHASV